MYDLAIIGGGPAGVAAGVYASRKRLKTIFITKDWGGQSLVSPEIQNWIGTIKVSGFDLGEMLKNHLKAYAEDIVDIQEGEVVAKITDNRQLTNDNPKGNDSPLLKGVTSRSFSENYGWSGVVSPLTKGVPPSSEAGVVYTVRTESGKTFDAKTVLITAGSHRRKLAVPNADKFEHNGITYCASCDGPLFADLDVAVVGGGNAGFETAAQLLAYCKSVTLLHRGDEFKADPVTVKKVLSNPKIHALLNVEILEVLGEKSVTGIAYRTKENRDRKELSVQGIFVEIGSVPSTEFVKELVELDKYGQIVVDPRNQRASVPGIWAAGDVTDGLYHQNNIAAGDAVKALEDIYLYIHASK